MPEMTWEATEYRNTDGGYVLERCHGKWNARDWLGAIDLGTFSTVEEAKAAVTEHAQQREGK